VDLERVWAWSAPALERAGSKRARAQARQVDSKRRIAMNVLLQRNVDKLGKIGDIVKVKPGFARNFLLPRGLAVEVTANNLNRFESTKRRLIAEEKETKAKFQLLAKELEKASCTIIANASEEGRLYGSVTARDIVQQYATEGLEVDIHAVQLEEPIKELGIYKVRIQLHAEVVCEAKVWVVKGDDRSGVASRRVSKDGSAGSEDALEDGADAYAADADRDGQGDDEDEDEK
jgi:large subunit ribosomal protein L9